MEQIVSLVVANGIFAVLFCGLLVYELKDSRSREGNYKKIISALSDRLKTVDDIKSDTDKIITDVQKTMSDVAALRSDAQKATRAKQKKSDGGGECAVATT